MGWREILQGGDPPEKGASEKEGMHHDAPLSSTLPMPVSQEMNRTSGLANNIGCCFTCCHLTLGDRCAAYNLMTLRPAERIDCAYYQEGRYPELLVTAEYVVTFTNGEAITVDFDREATPAEARDIAEARHPHRTVHHVETWESWRDQILMRIHTYRQH